MRDFLAFAPTAPFATNSIKEWSDIPSVSNKFFVTNLITYQRRNETQNILFERFCYGKMKKKKTSLYMYLVKKNTIFALCWLFFEVPFKRSDEWGGESSWWRKEWKGLENIIFFTVISAI